MRRSGIYVIFSIVTVVGFCAAALGEEVPNLGGIAQEYLEQQADANTPLVYSECKQADGRSILILPVSNGLARPPLPPFSNGLPREDMRDSGLLIQDLVGGRAINTGGVYFKRKHKEVGIELEGVDTGGAHTYQTSEALLHELLHSDFHLLFPVKMETLLTFKPEKTCKTRY